MKKTLVCLLLGGLLTGVANAKELTTPEKDAAIAAGAVGGAVIVGVALKAAYNYNVYDNWKGYSGNFLAFDKTTINTIKNRRVLSFWNKDILNPARINISGKKVYIDIYAHQISEMYYSSIADVTKSYGDPQSKINASQIFDENIIYNNDKEYSLLENAKTLKLKDYDWENIDRTLNDVWMAPSKTDGVAPFYFSGRRATTVEIRGGRFVEKVINKLSSNPDANLFDVFDNEYIPSKFLLNTLGNILSAGLDPDELSELNTSLTRFRLKLEQEEIARSNIQSNVLSSGTDNDQGIKNEVSVVDKNMVLNSNNTQNDTINRKADIEKDRSDSVDKVRLELDQDVE